MSSPLTKRFHWLTYLYFPFPAYMQIAQTLKWRPLASQATRAWEVMSSSFESRFGTLRGGDMDRPFHNPFFKIFTDIIIQAWEAREAAYMHEPLPVPRLVSYIRHKLSQMPSSAAGGNQNVAYPNYPTPVSAVFGGSMPYTAGAQDGSAYGYPQMAAAPLSMDVSQLDWSTMDLSSIDWSTMDWNMNAPLGEAGSGMY